MPPPASGGSTFAEHPDVPAADARLFWSAALDPAALVAEGAPSPRGIDLAALPLRAVLLRGGAEDRLMLARGGRRVTLGVRGGVHACRVDLVFAVPLAGLSAQALGLRRLAALIAGREARALWPPLPKAGRYAAMLSALDARAAGARLRDIAELLYGARAVAAGWSGRSDHLKSRVRRLVRDAAAMQRGGYRALVARGGGSSARGGGRGGGGGALYAE